MLEPHLAESRGLSDWARGGQGAGSRLPPAKGMGFVSAELGWTPCSACHLGAWCLGTHLHLPEPIASSLPGDKGSTP